MQIGRMQILFQMKQSRHLLRKFALINKHRGVTNHLQSKSSLVIADFGLRKFELPIHRLGLLVNAMSFNIIDVLLVILIALNLFNGYRRGFILGVLDLAGWVLSLLAG